MTSNTLCFSLVRIEKYSTYGHNEWSTYTTDLPVVKIIWTSSIQWNFHGHLMNLPVEFTSLDRFDFNHVKISEKVKSFQILIFPLQHNTMLMHQIHLMPLREGEKNRQKKYQQEHDQLKKPSCSLLLNPAPAFVTCTAYFHHCVQEYNTVTIMHIQNGWMSLQHILKHANQCQVYKQTTLSRHLLPMGQN